MQIFVRNSAKIFGHIQDNANWRQEYDQESWSYSVQSWQYSRQSWHYSGHKAVTIPDKVGTIPDKAGTIPDKVGSIPDKAGTIPDIIGTITYNIFFPWVIFRTNICIVHNMTKIFGTILDKHLNCPEYDQKS